jgi:hypothetical protein
MVVAAELAPGGFEGELPVDEDALLFPFREEGLDLCVQFLLRGDAAIQALFGQRRELHLDHVQPTAGLRREIELKPLGESKGFRRRKRFLQRAEMVRVEVVLHQADLLRSRIQRR